MSLSALSVSLCLGAATGQAVRRPPSPPMPGSSLTSSWWIPSDRSHKRKLTKGHQELVDAKLLHKRKYEGYQETAKGEH